MGLSWLGATSVLVLIAAIVFLTLPRLVKQSTSSQIQVEKSAEDILTAEEDKDGEAQLHGELLPSMALDGREEKSDGSFRQLQAKIPWQRLALFATALFFFLLALASALVALLGVANWAIPSLSLLFSSACLGALRYLAIQDAKRRGARYRRLAETAEKSSLILHKPQAGPAQARSQEVISAEDTMGSAPVRKSGQGPVSYIAQSLRYAKTHQNTARPELLGTAGQAELKDRRKLESPLRGAPQGWQPVQVPTPTYLEVEEAPSLAAGEEAQVSYLPVSSEGREETSPEEGSAPTSGLDAILSRRRVS